MDIRPIRNDQDHAAALAEIERLWGAPDGSPDGDKLDVLATLVEDYERRHHPVADADPVEILQYAIDEMGRTQAELATILASRSRASEILTRRRRLTAKMAHEIARAWNLPVELLTRPYPLASSPDPAFVTLDEFRERSRDGVVKEKIKARPSYKEGGKVRHVYREAASGAFTTEKSSRTGPRKSPAVRPRPTTGQGGGSKKR